MSPQERATEMRKWSDAYEFTSKTKGLDIAYDGYFYKQATGQFCNLTEQVLATTWLMLVDYGICSRWEFIDNAHKHDAVQI